jgi:Ni/Fe-hydrogenase 1 B-type cytochrome subunit
MSQTSSGQYRVYTVWDVPTRWFHWINALAVLGLIGIGVMLLNDDALGLCPAAR